MRASDLETETFIVHYEETNRNPTTEQNPVFQDAVAEGDNEPVHGDVVGQIKLDQAHQLPHMAVHLRVMGGPLHQTRILQVQKDHRGSEL